MASSQGWQWGDGGGQLECETRGFNGGRVGLCGDLEVEGKQVLTQDIMARLGPKPRRGCLAPKLREGHVPSPEVRGSGELESGQAVLFS